VVEIADCGPEGVTHSWTVVPPAKVTAHHVNTRMRLGADRAWSDHWFVYGKRTYEPAHERTESPGHYTRIAEEVTALLDSQAEPLVCGPTSAPGGETRANRPLQLTGAARYGHQTIERSALARRPQLNAKVVRKRGTLVEPCDDPSRGFVGFCLAVCEQVRSRPPLSVAAGHGRLPRFRFGRAASRPE
jgi:hypothetical protein